ncbi:MAG: hypothetical protein IKF11_00900 [Methanobrevibacter sp.]|nr:hypothetical protein [Methanobrevibacter sp.]
MKSMIDLRKKEEQSIMDKIDAFAMRYAYILLPIALIVLMVLIAMLILVLFKDVSAVESGNYYYKLESVI